MTESNTGAARNVVIIGGGIVGLSTAYFLQKKAREAGLSLTYTLLEGAERLGGNVITERVDGFLVEGGPDCFLSRKPWASKLVRELGMGDQLMGTNDHLRKVFVLNQGHLTPLPDGVLLIIPTRIWPFVTSTLISWPGKLRMGMDLLIPRRSRGGDESVGAFVRRRLGSEALEKIAEPLMSGIHVSDPERQSLLSTFPRFYELEQKHRSLILGMLRGRRAASGRSQTGNHTEGPSSLFVTMRHGLGQLVDGLQAALDGGKVVTGAQATDLSLKAGQGYQVRTADGRVWQGDAVVLATPAFVSASLCAGVDRVLANKLGDIDFVSTATISLGYQRDSFRHPLNGFGFVVPKGENRRMSACTWTSTKFDLRAPEDGVLLRCFVGGPGREDLVDLEDGALLQLVRDELKATMGLDAVPSMVRVFRWRKANPQYDVGHLERVQEIETLAAFHPGLILAGSSYEGVGIPDCVRQGEAAAQKVLALPALRGQVSACSLQTELIQ